MQHALSDARRSGAEVWGGERIRDGVPEGGVYVAPAIAEIDPKADVLREEIFAPLLFVSRYSQFAEAVRIVNDVPQGLSAAIFTTDLWEAHVFASAEGAVCGIVNVNVGTSGAEIGVAFGGEKATGGGREAGSDAWKGYMRRVARTVNYSTELPLAQGIRFSLKD
jgi:aldehyde dehydrogenase (NAD+)